MEIMDNIDFYKNSKTIPIIHIVNNYKVIEFEKSNIYIIENILDDYFCKKNIDFMNQLPLTDTINDNSNYTKLECFIGYSREFLKMNDIFFYKFNENNNDYITNALNGISKKELQNNINTITNKMKIVETIMKDINKYLQLKQNVGYNYKKIYGKTTIHTDEIKFIFNDDIIFNDDKYYKNNYNMIRNASIIFNLNDDYSGGIFNFPVQDVKIKLKKGSVLIFPPYWTHPHEVSNVENNKIRYTINTFTCEEVIPFNLVYN